MSTVMSYTNDIVPWAILSFALLYFFILYFFDNSNHRCFASRFQLDFVTHLQDHNVRPVHTDGGFFDHLLDE